MAILLYGFYRAHTCVFCSWTAQCYRGEICCVQKLVKGNFQIRYLQYSLVMFGDGFFDTPHTTYAIAMPHGCLWQISCCNGEEQMWVNIHYTLIFLSAFKLGIYCCLNIFDFLSRKFEFI